MKKNLMLFLLAVLVLTMLVSCGTKTGGADASEIDGSQSGLIASAENDASSGDAQAESSSASKTVESKADSSAASVSSKTPTTSVQVTSKSASTSQAPANPESEFNKFAGAISNSKIEKFSDVSALTTAQVAGFVFNYAGADFMKYCKDLDDYTAPTTVPVNELAKLAKSLFGKDFDFTSLKNAASSVATSASYNAATQTVDFVSEGGMGGGNMYAFDKFTTADNKNYTVTLVYGSVEEDQPRGTEGTDWINVDGFYFSVESRHTLKAKYENGLWSYLSFN